MSKSKHIERVTAFKTPEDSPGYVLWHVSLAWRNAIEAVLAPYNLTHPQFVILAAVGWLTRNGEQVSQLDVSRTSGLDPNTTSQILRGLELKELIHRARLLNERSKNPILTERGLDVLAHALPAVETADAHFFSALPADQHESLLVSLRALMTRPPRS